MEKSTFYQWEMGRQNIGDTGSKEPVYHSVYIVIDIFGMQNNSVLLNLNL